jgi:hypothetical protein
MVDFFLSESRNEASIKDLLFPILHVYNVIVLSTFQKSREYK